MDAGFAHHATAEFPVVKENGKNVRVVVGSLYGASSPVPTVHETIFGDVHLKAGASLPLEAGHEERAIYVIEGVVDIAGDKFEPGRLLVFKPGDAPTITAVNNAFSSSSAARRWMDRAISGGISCHPARSIEQAKADWKAGYFDKVGRDRVHSTAR
jgi:redox-sensitive bicupin YhaK (pirin superfamily)